MKVSCMCGRRHDADTLHEFPASRATEQTSTTDAVGGDEAGTPGHELAHGQRMVDYGWPPVSFTRIAGLWSTYLGVTIQPRDVGALMILLKVARMAGSTKPDTLDDIEGYVACIRMVDADTDPT